MQLQGRLVNASSPDRNDVFDGYAIEIRYLVLVQLGDTQAYKEVFDRFVCEAKDSSFSFDLPDAHRMAIDKDIEIGVRNRSQNLVLTQAHPTAALLRSEEPLELQVEPPPVSTPLSVRGRLVWRGDTTRTDGFDGFRVLANFSARDPNLAVASFAPRSASTSMAGSSSFEIALPDREGLDEAPIEVVVKYPDGQNAASEHYTLARILQPIAIEIDAQLQMVIKADERLSELKREKLKGKVVDLDGRAQVSNRQVVFWGKRADGTSRPILVATTDGHGNFGADRPKERFAEVAATVSATRNANPDNALPIDLVEQSDESPVGLLPTFVYLVVTLEPDASGDKDCACERATPRLPDPEDLVQNSDVYSQDIGLNCVNFTTPNRTLEEFAYTLVVRTTDPEIKGTTLTDLDRRVTKERKRRDRDIVAAGDRRRIAADVLNAQLIGRARETFADITELTQWKTVAGRGELNADNSVDWDGSPTFYQATTIAHGHILHFKQVWKADGYSLGDLLYSLPLAPGQKKQIVIFDWDRTEYGRRDEDKHEDEALSSYLGHTRDVLDITRGTLDEHVRGGSQSRTSGSAGGVGAGVGALIGPVMVGVAGGYSTSSGSASSSAWQDSSRNIAASGLNQLRDMVQQGASAVRNQRSTVVQTARQTERFKVETEVVANHNHCHAITMQYFEVLRHYAIEQKLTHVQECLFIPLLMSEFTIEKVVRWMDILRYSLRLPPRGRLSIFGAHPLVRGLDAAERIFRNYEGSDFPTDSYASEGIVSWSGELTITFQLNRPLDDDDNADDPSRQEQLITAATLAGALGWAIWWPLVGNANYIFGTYFANQKVKYKNRIFEERVAPVLAAAVVDELVFTAVSANGVRVPLTADTTLVSNYQRDVKLYVTVRPTGPVNVRRDQISFIEIGTNVDLSSSERSKIIVNEVTFRYSTPHLDGYLARNYRADNDLKPNDPVAIYTPLSAEEKSKPREEDKQFSNLLLDHLNANLEYYHKAIWRRMDPDRRYMLLDGFVAPNANGKSVASVVENRVIGVAGNALIMPVAPGYKLDPTYAIPPKLGEDGDPLRDDEDNPLYETVGLLEHYQPLTPIPPFRISVPTRGVFGESIMGACNACEKKDETRFWRWEESPNPDEPTPIEAIQTNPPSRSDPGDLKPEAFPTPMINIQNAPPAPDAGATLSGALNLLGKSDVFRDVTGLEQTQKNALQAMLSNQESAKHFADTAAQLAVQAANLKSGNTTIESIKKSIADGSLDEKAGKKLIEDTYRAQIGGKATADNPANTAGQADLGKAAAQSVKEGKAVKATQTYPDGTSTVVDQSAGTGLQQASYPGGAAGLGQDLQTKELARRATLAPPVVAAFEPTSESTLISYGVEWPAPSMLVVKNWKLSGLAHYGSVFNKRRIGGRLDTGPSPTPVIYPTRNLPRAIVLHETVGWAVVGAGDGDVKDPKTGAMHPFAFSVHFSVGPDGTVFQHNDIAQILDHGSKANTASVGIEVTNISAFEKANPPPGGAVVPSGQTAPLKSLQTEQEVGGMVTDDRVRIPVAWIDGTTTKYLYVMPSQAQLEGVAQLVSWLCSGTTMTAVATFLNVLERSHWPAYRVTAAGSGAGTTTRHSFILHHNPAWTTSSYDAFDGIYAHQNFEDARKDGGVPMLYAWLRLFCGKNASDAYSDLSKLVSDAKYAHQVEVAPGVKAWAVNVSEMVPATVTL